jgi:hypothetical protein
VYVPSPCSKRGSPGSLVYTALLLLTLVAIAPGCRTVIDPAAIADAQTAARVKTALVNDPALGTRTIEVRVVAGVVELSGRVLTEEESARAVALVRMVPGVLGVRAGLQVGGEDPPELDEPASVGDTPDSGSAELQDNPNLLAIGGSIGWSDPRATALKTRGSISPLIRFGSGRGFRWTLGLDWFQTEVQSLADRPQTLTRVSVKPIMLGAGYTVGTERVSLTTSLVGGYAWNSLSVTDTGLAEGLPVEVDNSLAWRPGISIWFDTSRRTAVNVSLGHVMTRLRLTVLDDGHLVPRSVRGNTTVVHAGVAYKLF